MYNLFTIMLIISGLIMLYLFYSIIYNKIKLYRVRLKMQEQGQINQSENLTANTFCNLIFWIYPITKSGLTALLPTALHTFIQFASLLHE